MSITEVAIKRPLLVTVIFTILALFGFMSYTKLNYNLLPKIAVNIVTISTVYPGAAATEVETSVTKKLEDIISSVEGLDQLSATSQQGVSIITITLKATASVDKAEQDVQRLVDQGLNQLPNNADRPVVKKVNLDETPVVQAGVTSKLEARALYDLVDQQIRPLLQNTSGVGQLNVIGGDERQIQVNIDQQKMNSYNLSIAQVTGAISNANQSFPAGSIETRNSQLSINYDANVVSLDQLRNLIISTREGSIIHLSDVANIIDATAEPTAINRINGLPAIGLQIIKQSDANAVDVSKATKKTFAALEQQYASQGLKFSISADQSTYTLASANAVIEDLFLAVLIVGFVMLAFLHSVRSSMFVLIALPSSIIPTFILMYLFGFSLNLMTLMALSLVVGILVDDSIVVLENIYRHLEMGTERRQAAIEGRSEIGFTALAITLVDVVVFLPLALSGGIIGQILREFSLVVVFSTLMSLFVSFTITPLLASRFGRLEHLTKNNLWGRLNLGFEKIIDHTRDWYGRALTKVLHKKRWLLGGVIILIIGAIMLPAKGFIGGAFIPESDQGQLLLSIELQSGVSIYQTNQITQQAEKKILAHPEVTNTFSSVGFVTGSVAGTGSNNNQAQITVSLVDKKHRKQSSQEFGLILQQEIANAIPGAKVNSAATSISGNNGNSPIQISVQSVNLNDVRTTAESIRKIVASIPGAQNAQLSVKDPKPEIELKLDREKMTLLGVNAAQVGQALQTAFSGNDKNKFRQNGKEYEIFIRLDPGNRTALQDVQNLTFQTLNGQTFTLGQFATVYQGTGESVLQRTNRLSSITINANVVGRPVGTVVNEIQQKMKSLQVPAGTKTEFLGDAKNQAESFQSLGIALLTAIVLVYLIMVALYENAVYPFVVLFSIPVALIGALLALALTMQTLNIFSIIGMIMLLGLVAKNAILIVDFANQLKAEGKPVREALVEAGKERLRPILMTTMAMIFGMLPIALASGAGSEIKNGMAWAIIGGLTSSMILTLFVVPSMYLIIERLTTRKQQKTKTAEQQPARIAIATEG